MRRADTPGTGLLPPPRPAPLASGRSAVGSRARDARPGTERARAAAPLPKPKPAGGRTTPRWWRDAAESLLWLSLLAVTALWVARGGVQLILAGPGDALVSLGRLTALLSANLLLVQVLLMARLPVLERAVGRVLLIRWHRWVGLWSVALLLAHIPLVVLGHAWQAGTGPLSVGAEMLRSYDGVALAAVGALLVVAVAVFSATRLRRRLPYELWYLLHLHAYVGIAVAVPHQLLVGGTLSSPVAQVYWWALWLAAATAVVTGRIVAPLSRAVRHRARVSAVVAEAPGVVSVHISGQRFDTLGAQAGQFLRWRFLAASSWWQVHPYSLSAAPTSDRLRITVRLAGSGSAALAQLRPGTRVMLDGPFGRFTEEVATGRPVTLLAAGIGVAPLRALLETLAAGPGRLTLIHRVHSLEQAPLREENDALGRRRGARVLFVDGPRIRGRRTWLPQSVGHLRDEEALLALVPDIGEHDVYVCGPPQWAAAAAEAAHDAGVPLARIHTEDFSW